MSVLLFSMKTLTKVLLKIKSERESLDCLLNLIKPQNATKIVVNRRWSAKLLLLWFSLIKVLFRSSRDNAFLRDCNGTWTHNNLVRKRTLNHLVKLVELILWAVTRFAASNTLVTKKNDYKARHLTMTYGKTLWPKTIRLL